MRKRILSFLLAASAAFCFISSCAPEAQAIVPIGFVQSALASYVSSTGYKLYNDNGTGQDILGSLGELYDDYVTVNNKTIQGSVATLAWLANSPLIYQDNSGQIVISQVAANIMQDFAEWIETEYSVPVGSDVPTTVLSGDEIWSDGNGIQAVKLDLDSPCYLNGTSGWYVSPFPLGTYPDNSEPTYLVCEAGTMSVYATRFRQSGYSEDNLFLKLIDGSSRRTCLAFMESNGRYRSFSGFGYPTSSFSTFGAISNDYYANIPLSSVLPSGNPSLSGDAVVGLAVSLAQAVADVIGQAQDDDAVVIGVGAGVGATAQDIADMVAQGVKAQTLDPSVSIVAEAVIDTPVQPYPDIDGLGLPTLGAALVDRFPFCIPWDFVDTVRLLSADPQPINIKVDLIPQRIKTAVGISSDTSFDIDLSGEQYAKIGVFCRWGSLIGFCFGLFLLTKRLVWTA